jgi:signal peptidase I
MKKILGHVLSIAITLALVFLVLLAYGSLNNRWYKVIAVEGNSMSPALWFGDLIVLTHPTANIPAGDIITMSVDSNLVSHRLVTAYQGGWPETKGDANNAVDNFTTNDVKIVGIVHLRIPWLGYPILYIQNLISNIQS